MIRAMAASPQPPAALAPQRRGRRRVLLLGLLLVALGAVATVILVARRATTPSAAEPTVWQSITAGITDGAVPKNVALEAFAYDYAVSIPGVQLPAGRDDDGAPSDGSGPLRWVQNHWSELNPDQQAVIDRYIEPGPNDDVTTFSLPGQGEHHAPRHRRASGPGWRTTPRYTTRSWPTSPRTSSAWGRGSASRRSRPAGRSTRRRPPTSAC